MTTIQWSEIKNRSYLHISGRWTRRVYTQIFAQNLLYLIMVVLTGISIFIVQPYDTWSGSEGLWLSTAVLCTKPCYGALCEGASSGHIRDSTVQVDRGEAAGFGIHFKWSGLDRARRAVKKEYNDGGAQTRTL